MKAIPLSEKIVVDGARGSGWNGKPKFWKESTYAQPDSSVISYACEHHKHCQCAKLSCGCLCHVRV